MRSEKESLATKMADNNSKCPYCGESGYWITDNNEKECCKYCESCNTYKSATLTGWTYDDDGDCCPECSKKTK